MYRYQRPSKDKSSPREMGPNNEVTTHSSIFSHLHTFFDFSLLGAEQWVKKYLWRRRKPAVTEEAHIQTAQTAACCFLLRAAYSNMNKEQDGIYFDHPAFLPYL